MSRFPGIDPFLSHLPDAKPTTKAEPKRIFRGGISGNERFDALQDPNESFFESLSFESMGSVSVADESSRPDDSGWLPVLVRLPNPKYMIPAAVMTEFKESFRLGNVLSGRGSKEALLRLGALSGVIVEVSREGGSWELDTSISTIRGNDVAAPDGGEPEDRCIVGVIDAGIDPMHHAFLGRDGKTRLRYIWDQSSSGGPSPKDSGLGFSFDYGVLHQADSIDAAVARGESWVIPRGASEEALLHGTHVASIAAGRVVEPLAKTSFVGGMAPDAPIVFVVPSLNTAPGDRPSQGFAKSHVDALSFIGEVASRLSLPAVVNVSSGIACGAHDGSSTLEAGFDAFTDGGHAPGRAVVKSAGNAREASRYAQLSLATTGQLTITVSPSLVARGPSVVEVWFSSAHDVELTVSEGERPASAALSLRNPAVSYATRFGDVTMSYERFHRDNGDSQLLLRLPESEYLTLVFCGKLMRGKGEIDVWVEGPVTLSRSSQEGTLTVPGSARTVITVASSDRAGLEIANSSSNGPTRDGRKKPELFAPGVDIRAAKARTATGTVAMSGTSMAAPHVTGAVALLFSRQARTGGMLPNAVQTCAALVASASAMDGNWQSDRGFGLLNAQQLLAAFS